MATKKIPGGITLDAIAQELGQVVQELKKGKIRVGSSLVQVGDPSFLKTKQKIKDDQVYFTLSFRVPIEGETRAAAPHTKSRTSRDKHPGTEPAKNIKRPSEGSPPGAKKLKKEITRLWKDVSKILDEGRSPSRSEANQLTSKCDDYTIHAPSSWADEWQNCCKVVRECMEAAMAGDMNRAQNLVDEVNRQTKACHKKFK